MRTIRLFVARRRVWLCRWAVTSGLLCAALVACPLRADAQQDVMPAQCRRLLDFVEFKVLSGRLLTAPLKVGNTASAEAEQDGVRHALALDLSDAQANFTYRQRNERSLLEIEVRDGDSLLISRQPRQAEGEEAPTTALEFTQEPRSPLELEVGAGEQGRRVVAPSIWHLMLLEPELCQQELLPLLDLLSDDWPLATVYEQLPLALLQWARSPRSDQQQLWDELVAQLASDQFSLREAADRQLREAGPALLPWLRRVDAARLDAEQRFRIRRILASLGSVESPDTVDAIVAWVAGDPLTWVGLAGSDDAETRRAAAEQLARLAGTTIDFEPDADPEIRAAQLARLRDRFAAD